MAKKPKYKIGDSVISSFRCEGKIKEIFVNEHQVVYEIKDIGAGDYFIREEEIIRQERRIKK